jgi:hypothetical protein
MDTHGEEVSVRELRHILTWLVTLLPPPRMNSRKIKYIAGRREVNWLT